jgi:hypothetical protein
MKVSVPVLVKDPEVANWKGVPLVENFTIAMEDRFLDGPVTRRVAVLDFDDTTGGLRRGAKFLQPKQGRKIGRYDVPTGSRARDLEDSYFMQVVVFGGVGLGAIGGRHVPVSRPAEPAAPLHSPAARRLWCTQID